MSYRKIENGILLIRQTDYNRLTTLGSTTVPSGRRTTKYVLSTGSSPACLLLTFDLLAFETLNLRGMQQLWGDYAAQWAALVEPIVPAKNLDAPMSKNFVSTRSGLCRLPAQSRVAGQETGTGSAQDRPVGTEHKNLPHVRLAAGDAPQGADIRLRGLRPCRTPGLQRVS